MRLLAKEVNADLRENILKRKEVLNEKGINPKLLTIRIGEDGPSISYEKGINKKMASFDFDVENKIFDINVSEGEVCEFIKNAGKNDDINGILLFQPLPERLDANRVKEMINPDKDIDCSTVLNLGNVLAGIKDTFCYCAPDAVMELIHHYDIPLKGKDVVIVGAGLVVGRPLSMLLSAENATVSLCNVFTKDLKKYTKDADIVISATGVPGLINAELVSEGQIIIDVGVSFKNGKIKGDVDMESVAPIVKAYTPTPGGISGITTTILAKHLVMATENMN